MARNVRVSMALAAMLLAACGANPTSGEIVPVEGGSYHNMSPSDLQMSLRSKNFLLVNVHVPFAGNIAGTDLAVPYDQIGSEAVGLPSDTNAMIVLYCKSGRMSAIAAESLVKLGYSNVWNLNGGMVDWERAGFGIER